MAGFDDIVDVSTSIETPLVSNTGFKVPLFAAEVSNLGAGFTERTRTYLAGGTQAATDLAAGDINAAVKAAIDEAFAQDKRTSSVKIGRLEADVAQVITWTFSGSPEVGDTMTIIINGISTTYTVASTVLNTEVDALKAAVISAISAEDVTMGGSSPAVTATADTAGAPFTQSASIVLVASGTLAVAEVETTANVGISSELDAIIAEDNDWYGLATSSLVKLQIQRAAAWAETNRKLYFAQSSDADILTAVTTDLASLLKTSNYKHTAVLYHALNAEHAAFAWLCTFLETDPDEKSTVASEKTLEGITTGSLTGTQLVNLRAKNANAYLALGSSSATGPGNVANGNWIDLVWTADFVTERMKEDIIALLLRESNANRKVPYTPAGRMQVKSSMDFRGAELIRTGHLETFEVVMPKWETISASVKDSRALSMAWQGAQQGAIGSVSVSGTISNVFSA